MVSVVVSYHHCWSVEGAPAGSRPCQIEQFQDNGKIVGTGKVLYKCANHRRVSDETLPEVLRAESLAAKRARAEAPPDTVPLILFDNAFVGPLGRARRVKARYMPRESSDG